MRLYLDFWHLHSQNQFSRSNWPESGSLHRTRHVWEPSDQINCPGSIQELIKLRSPNPRKFLQEKESDDRTF